MLKLSTKDSKEISRPNKEKVKNNIECPIKLN